MAAKKDPDETVHLQAKPGEVIRLGDKSFGDRGTVQVRRGDLDRIEGSYEEVDPEHLPDVAERPTPAPSQR